MVFQVLSEVGKLKQVLLHRPGREMDRLTPSNMDQLLYDDLLWLKQAQREHDQFAQLLRDSGVQVLLLQDLLAETLQEADARQTMDYLTFDHRVYGPSAARLLAEYASGLSAQEYADLLIAGITKREFESEFGPQSSAYFSRLNPDEMLVRCLPNHLFTRDTSCWINRGVSLSSMQMPARRREITNLQVIYRFHPKFVAQDFSFWANGRQDWPATVEGGDVEVIGNGTVLVGVSERTTPAGLELLAQKLLSSDSGVQRVIGLIMPQQRALMHLDTVMTMVNRDTFLKYRHLGDLPSVWIEADQPAVSHRVPARGGVPQSVDLRIKTYPAPMMNQVLAWGLGVRQVNMLTVPEDNLAAERGQWNDACNLLCLSENVVFAYDRNEVANQYLRSQGVTVLEVPGSELGRGRGGPRCMSCPLERESL